MKGVSNMKKFFSTPKKAVISILCIVALVAALGTVSAFAASAIAEGSSIGSANAANFAFADAGVDPAQAQLLRTEFDHELGQFVYEVEFIHQGTEYEYYIRASDGTVLKKDLELKYPAEQSASAQSAVSAALSLEEAKTLALKDAGVTEAQATFTRERLDYDDGLALYELKFYTESARWEYDIDASTGRIVSKEEKAISAPGGNIAGSSDNTASTQAADESAYIGIEAAKALALEHAGVSEKDSLFSKAKLEREDGRMVYELEFYSNNIEYDYEIDALSGTILDFDSDWD